MKTKIIFGLIVVVVVAAAGWAMTGNNPEEVQEVEQDSTSNNAQEGDVVVEEVDNSLVGELRLSNDLKRGNLMLELQDSDRFIYLNTTRDFTSLVGKTVSVSIDGSPDDFRLIDIKEK